MGEGESLIIEGEGESVGVPRLAIGVVDVERSSNNKAGISVEALSIGEGELAISVELALDSGVNIQLVGSSNCELRGGGLCFVKVEGSIKTCSSSSVDAVVVGDSDSVALEETKESEDVVIGGVSSSSIDCRESSTGVLGLETHGESLISNNSSKCSISSLSVQDIHGSVDGDVVVLVLTIELDGIEFLGVNNGGQLQSGDKFVDGHLEFGVLVCVSSESHSHSVLNKGVFGVDHSQESITVFGQAQLMDHSIGSFCFQLKFGLVRELLGEQVRGFLANI